MKKITVTWKHYDKEGETCDRCGKTRANILQVISELQPLLISKNITLEYREEKLAEKNINQSNTIFLNGVPIGDLLPAIGVQYTSCDSCSRLASKDISCRAIKYKGIVYEDIPKDVFLTAVKRHVEGSL